MRFFICPMCGCVNKKDAQKCDNCGMPSLAIMMMPNLRWIEHESVKALREWLNLMKQRMGCSLFTKLEVR